MFQTGHSDPINSVALQSLERFDKSTDNQMLKCPMYLVLGQARREP
jgi:hypothetical protein